MRIHEPTQESLLPNRPCHFLSLTLIILLAMSSLASLCRGVQLLVSHNVFESLRSISLLMALSFEELLDVKFVLLISKNVALKVKVTFDPMQISDYSL